MKFLNLSLNIDLGQDSGQARDSKRKTLAFSELLQNDRGYSRN